MPTNENRSVVVGSERQPLHGANAIGPTPNDERIEVTVRVRRQKPLAESAAKGVNDNTKPKDRRYLTREDYAANHGSHPDDLKKVEQFATDHGLQVLESDAARRSVFISGRTADIAAAFGTTIENFEHDGGTYRGRTGPLTLPSDLVPIVEGVFGIDDRPIAKPHFQRQRPVSSIGIQPHAAQASFTPPQLAKVYGFPTGLDGSGQTIGIIELGGGFRPADIKTYFHELGLPTPKVIAVKVDGAKNQPSTADGADGEVMLDIEVAAAVAPKAKIVVYFAPNTDQGFLDAITKAIHDTANKPSVISISWGSAESNWTSQAKTSFDQAFQSAAALGVTITVAAGDNGSADGQTDGSSHVDFPSSSPNVLGCGGTKLSASGTTISSEVVWNEGPNSSTGGGISDFFPVPNYQSGVHLPTSHAPGRGVPDVAGDADPATGYQVRVDGQEFVIGGTSAVAPLWAGLVALFNQSLGHTVGFLNPLIYGSLAGKGGFRDITVGNNGAYSAGAGWDPTTGWGSPNGAELLKELN